MITTFVALQKVCLLLCPFAALFSLTLPPGTMVFRPLRHRNCNKNNNQDFTWRGIC